MVDKINENNLDIDFVRAVELALVSRSSVTGGGNGGPVEVMDHKPTPKVDRYSRQILRENIYLRNY
jgi:hypothetical protein